MCSIFIIIETKIACIFYVFIIPSIDLCIYTIKIHKQKHYSGHILLSNILCLLEDDYQKYFIEVGLSTFTLNQIITRRNTTWKIKRPAKIGFYKALSDALDKSCLGLTCREKGQIFRQVDQRLSVTVQSDYTAYQKVHRICKRKQNVNNDDNVSYNATNEQIDNELRNADQHYSKKNVDRRDKRNKNTITSLNQDKESLIETTQSYIQQVEDLQEDLKIGSEKILKLVNQKQLLIKTKHKEKREWMEEREVLTEDLKEVLSYAKQLYESQKLKDQQIHSLETQFQECQNIIDDQDEMIEEMLEALNKEKKISSKEGKTYTDEIRALYYVLLADQVPPNKISKWIKTILSHLTDYDISDLKLPCPRTCRSMRRTELKTVSQIHKATFLHEKSVTSNQSCMQSDGTTLNQIKINGFGIDGIIISLSEVLLLWEELIIFMYMHKMFFVNSYVIILCSCFVSLLTYC